MSQIKKTSFWRNKFLVMIFGAVVITCLLVVVSMSMYSSSGAAQLDLSRPGYVSVRDKAVKSDADFQTFSSSCEINQKTISKFKVSFTKQAVKVKTVDAFGGDPLSPQSLGIDSVEPVEATQ